MLGVDGYSASRPTFACDSARPTPRALSQRCLPRLARDRPYRLPRPLPGRLQGLVEQHGIDVTTVESYVRYRARLRFDDRLAIWAQDDRPSRSPLPLRVRDRARRSSPPASSRRAGPRTPVSTRRRSSRRRMPDGSRVARASRRRRLAALVVGGGGCGSRSARRRLRLARFPRVAAPARRSPRRVRRLVRRRVRLRRRRRAPRRRRRLRPDADDLRLGHVARVPDRVVQDVAIGVVDDPPHRDRPRRARRTPRRSRSPFSSCRIEDPLSPPARRRPRAATARSRRGARRAFRRGSTVS